MNKIRPAVNVRPAHRWKGTEMPTIQTESLSALYEQDETAWLEMIGRLSRALCLGLGRYPERRVKIAFISITGK